MPPGVMNSKPSDDQFGGSEDAQPELGEEEGGPFESQRIEILNAESDKPQDKKTRQWIRARGKISPRGGHQAHLSALAYMSDSYFIGTVSRVHNLWRFTSSSSKPKEPKDASDKLPSSEEYDEYIKKLKEFEGFGHDLENAAKRPEIGMMVSLDHSIYFHEPRRFRADQWMFTEMHSPWAGDGRGLVIQHMWAADGTLIATCVQEGVVRLKQDGTEAAKKSKL